MYNTMLFRAALNELLRHLETGCPQAASHAARLLELLADEQDVDRDTQDLFDRASQRLLCPTHHQGEAHVYPS